MTTKKIELNGITINYRDEGEGEVLLLVHNLTSNIKGFSRNISELSKYYRVIAADLRGHGETTHEEDYDKARAFYTFDNLANDQLALLDHLGVDQFYLFGQAFWGLNTALHLFEKVPGRVKGIAVSSANMIISDEERKPYEALGEEGRKNFLRMHEMARAEGMMAVYNDRLKTGQFWGPRVLNSPDILAEFREAHETTSPVAFVMIPYLREERRVAISTALKKRALPLLLLLGEDEKASNRSYFIDQMRNDYPPTHVMLIPSSGHYPTIENPYDFNRAILNFFAGVSKYT